MFEVELEPDLDLPGAIECGSARKFLCQPEGCPHLSENPRERCQVYERRPRACRQFPFRISETPGGQYVGASFACTAIQTNQGPPLQADSRNWSELTVIREHPPLQCSDDGTPCAWTDYQHIEEYLADQLCFPDGAFAAAIQLSLALSQGRLSQLGSLPLQWLSEDIEATCQRTIRGLLALMESQNQSQQMRLVLEAQVHGGRYWSEAFGCWAEPRKIQQQMQTEKDDHWHDVEPFFRHLLFRKFLWAGPSVHARCCLLPLLNEILRYWSWQQAVDKGTAARREHRLESIREMERRLTFHASGWEDYLRPLGRAFLSGVR